MSSGAGNQSCLQFSDILIQNGAETAAARFILFKRDVGCIALKFAIKHLVF